MSKISRNKLVFQNSGSAKEKGEPFVCRINLASLYIFYILGVAKLNPLNSGSRYETLLGTFYNPKTINHIELAVRPGFVDELTLYSGQLEKDYKAYAIIHELEGPRLYYLSFHPSTDILSKITHIDGIPYPVLKDPSVNRHEAFAIAILTLGLLDKVKDLSDKCPDYHDGFDKVVDRILNGDPSVIGVKDKAIIEAVNHVYLKINDLISMVSLSHSEYLGGLDVAPFYDRDTLFNYLVVKGYGVEEAYSIMETVRKGKKVAEDRLWLIPTEDREKFRRCRYLAPRGYSSELVYYYLLAAII